MSTKSKLFDQFPAVSTKEWMDRIAVDLKGADFYSRLVWKTGMGIDVMPFYRQEDIEKLEFADSLPGELPFIRGKKTGSNNWRIRQNIAVTDYAAANRKAMGILERGVDSIGFYISDPGSASRENFKILLKDIDPEVVELNFLSDGMAKEIVVLYTDYINRNGFSPEKVTGAIEADPLSRLMLNGTLCIPVGQGFDYLSSVARLTSSLPGFRAVHLNASNFRNAGGDIVQELAFGIAMGTEYMAQLTKRGISADVAASKIRFSFGTGSEFLPEVAKLRAARLLWSVVTSRFQPGNDGATGMEIHCVTNRWNKTEKDPYTNILRTQTEAMSAILGGTDSLTVEPFDIVFR